MTLQDQLTIYINLELDNIDFLEGEIERLTNQKDCNCLLSHCDCAERTIDKLIRITKTKVELKNSKSNLFSYQRLLKLAV